LTKEWVNKDFWDRLSRHIKSTYPQFYWNTKNEILEANARARAAIEEKGTTGVDETRNG
jgi:hypothetical protein